MPLSSFHPTEDRLQKRWILLALGGALLLHGGIAGVFGWYKIPHLETPANHSEPVGPFSVKHVEIDASTLKADQPDPIAKLPVAAPPSNPSDFNLDPELVVKALQTPQPTLSAPSVPEPSRVIAAADLTQAIPVTDADTAKVTADISKVLPEASGSTLNSAKLAQDLVNSSAGLQQPGAATGEPTTGNGAAGQLPGFQQLVPGFKASGPTLSNLPEPILLRLPSDVLFDFDSAQLKPEAAGLLGQATTMITRYKQAHVEVDGYSDSFGQAEYNRTLSQQRAEAVQAWLQDHADSGDYQFKSQGHGSSNFVVSAQGSIQQQQPNRRVEIVIQALKPE